VISPSPAAVDWRVPTASNDAIPFAIDPPPGERADTRAATSNGAHPATARRRCHAARPTRRRPAPYHPDEYVADTTTGYTLRLLAQQIMALTEEIRDLE
jgi:hypothetical protein